MPKCWWVIYTSSSQLQIRSHNHVTPINIHGYISDLLWWPIGTITLPCPKVPYTPNAAPWHTDSCPTTDIPHKQPVHCTYCSKPTSIQTEQTPCRAHGGCYIPCAPNPPKHTSWPSIAEYSDCAVECQQLKAEHEQVPATPALPRHQTCCIWWVLEMWNARTHGCQLQQPCTNSHAWAMLEINSHNHQTQLAISTMSVTTPHGPPKKNTTSMSLRTSQQAREKAKGHQHRCKGGSGGCLVPHTSKYDVIIFLCTVGNM